MRRTLSTIIAILKQHDRIDPHLNQWTRTDDLYIHGRHATVATRDHLFLLNTQLITIINDMLKQSASPGS